MHEGGRGFGNATVFVASCSVSLGINTGGSGVASLDHVSAGGTVWRPIVATNRGVSSWATCRQEKQTSVSIHCDGRLLF